MDLEQVCGFAVWIKFDRKPWMKIDPQNSGDLLSLVREFLRDSYISAKGPTNIVGCYSWENRTGKRPEVTNWRWPNWNFIEISSSFQRQFND